MRTMARWDTAVVRETRVCRLSRRPGSGVVRTVADGRSFAEVRIGRAAPLSRPDRYICFLDSAGQEICMVHDLAEVAPAERILIEEELKILYITSVIRKLISVHCEAGVVYCKAETDRGFRELVIQNSDESVRWLSDRRVLLIDVDGNRFEVPDAGALDRSSARMLT